MLRGSSAAALGRPMTVADAESENVTPPPSSSSVPAYASPGAETPLSTDIPLHDIIQHAPPGWLASLSTLPKVYGLTTKEMSRIAARNVTAIDAPVSSGASLGNGLVIGAISLASRALMRSLNGVHTYRLGNLTDAIEKRPQGVGLLTVSNHRSVIDDPIMLATLLPPRILVTPGRMRWGLCAVDICYQNKALARFMSLGKALPVMRNGGIGHPFVAAAAEKLAQGDWLHVYPEGRVVQRGMGYMKRGVGKMLTVAHERGGAVDDGSGARGTIVLPMYHEGVEDMMPQDVDTHELLGIVPKMGYRLFTIVGEPLDVRDIFERLMPPCARAGGSKSDAPECVEMYEALADRCALAVRLLRAELRLRVRLDHGVFLGDPYENS